MSSSRTRFVVVALGGAMCALGLSPSDAMPARSDAVTITMLAPSPSEPSWDVLIANFDRVYPNIKVEATFAPSATVQQLEATELAAGNAPDLLESSPGCGTTFSICVLAKANDLAPIIKAPWVKRSLPLVTSDDKYGQGLYAFLPTVSPYGVFTNDDLFKKLGLRVPQTFSQLLDVCQKAKADGTAAVLLSGANTTSTAFLIYDLAVPTVYGKDKQWTAELKAGKVSFDGTAGWHQALQNFVDMNNAGCFEPGVTGTTGSETEFAQGQGLMEPDVSGQKGTIDAASPSFKYSFYPFPGGTAANQTRTFLNLAGAVSVNAHSSAANQAAAETFIDFVARPKEDALYAQVGGGLTQYEFLKQQIPTFMSALAPMIKGKQYVIRPSETWWNAGVSLALQQYQIGLITGQSTIDQILNAMDAAWKQGPT